MLKIHALGYPEVYINDQLIEKFLSTKVIVLLVFLAMKPQTHSRERLATLLWGEMLDDKAKSNLRQALHDLNKRIDGYFDITRQSVKLHEDKSYQVDALEFRAIATRPDASIDDLENAVTLYTGSFLEGINLNAEGEIDDWLRSERENLRLLYLEILEKLGDFFMNAGEWKRAQQVFTRSLQSEPLRESTYRQLMLTLARQGRYEEAINQYLACQDVMETELGILPTGETLEVYSRIRRARNKPNAMFPTQPYAFVGRDNHLQKLASWLQATSPRLITITGEGGVGKTRLAVEAVQGLEHHFLDGIAFVPLAGARDLVVGIADVLIQQGFLDRRKLASSLGDSLLDLLQEHEMLLILDNLEHLIDQYSYVLDLLDAAPYLKILVTSRITLNIRPEQIMRLEGLTYPETTQIPDWQEYDAPALFLQTAARQDYKLAAEDRAPITEICEFVQGLPLAIELAAVHTQQQACTTIAKQIQQRYDALVTTMHDLPSRQVSMRATFDYSLELLDEHERLTLARLSVFVGATSSAAIYAITEAPPEVINQLVHQSLLRHMEDDIYIMHELLRQYATELLQEYDETDRMRTRHAHYYLEKIRASHKAVHSENAHPITQKLLKENENIQAAWYLAIEHVDSFASLMEASMDTLREVYDRNGLAYVSIDLFRQLAQRAREQGADHLACHFELNTSFLYFRLGKFTESVILARAILEDSNCHDDPNIALGAYTHIIQVHTRTNQTTEVEEYSKKAIQLADNVATATSRRSAAYSAIGTFCQAQGKLDEAATLQRQALEIARNANLKPYEASALGNLGVAIGFQDPDKAAEYFRAALKINKAMQDLPGMATAYNNLAIYARVKGDRALQEECLNQTLLICQELKDESGMALLAYEMGAACYEWGEYENAINHFQSGLAYFAKNDSITKQVVGLCRIAHSIRMQGHFIQAQKFYRQAASLALEKNELYLLIEIVAGISSMETDVMLATEWIGAAQHHLGQVAPTDRLGPYVQPVYDDLKHKLPADDFEAALKRGATLSLQQILSDNLLIGHDSM